MLITCEWKPEKLSLVYKDSIVVLTHMRESTLLHLYTRLSQGLHSKTWHSWLTF